MKITQGGLYQLGELDATLEIESSDPVAIIDDGSAQGDISIAVSGKTRCHIYGCIKGGQRNIHVVNIGEGCESQVRYVLIGEKEDTMKAKILSQLSASHTTTNVHILSTVADKSSIELDGTVQIDAGIESASGHILEENVFMGESGKIVGIPSLLVRSNDVAAGHAARIERIPEDKLYYLRARGIPKDDATVMMLASALSQVFDGLEKFDNDLKEGFLEESLKSVVGSK